jgi:hypothetical protein
MPCASTCGRGMTTGSRYALSMNSMTTGGCEMWWTSMRACRRGMAALHCVFKLASFVLRLSCIAMLCTVDVVKCVMAAPGTMHHMCGAAAPL